MAGLPLLGDNISSRQSTEDELKKLRYQENILLDRIVHHEGTMKAMIIEMADSMAKRFELLDPLFPAEFSLDQISTEISRLLRSQSEPCPVASCVRQYLPDKYKNLNMARQIDVIEHTKNIIEYCGVLLRKGIEHCSHHELETLLQFLKKAKNDGTDKTGTVINNLITEVRGEGLRRGISLDQEVYRDQISSRDYRYEMPDSPDLHEWNKEVMTQGDRVIHEYTVFFHQNYPEYPAYTIEKAKQYANSLRVYANMMAIINEKKWSGDIAFWLDRNYWKKAQSSHKSGNSTMWPTTLCVRCSSNVTEDPKDFHVVRYDKNSPTNYRCDNCGGTEYTERENSREQIGDKSPEIDRIALEIVQHIEHYVDVFQDVRINSMDPAIYARKKAIEEEFSKASMGKEKIVVPRKKNK